MLVYTIIFDLSFSLLDCPSCLEESPGGGEPFNRFELVDGGASFSGFSDFSDFSGMVSSLDMRVDEVSAKE